HLPGVARFRPRAPRRRRECLSAFSNAATCTAASRISAARCGRDVLLAFSCKSPKVPMRARDWLQSAILPHTSISVVFSCDLFFVTLRGANMKWIYGLFFGALTLGLAAPGQAWSWNSEQPGSVLVFPKFIRGTINDLVISRQAVHAITELEISVVCPTGATCGANQAVRL